MYLSIYLSISSMAWYIMINPLATITDNLNISLSIYLSIILSIYLSICIWGCYRHNGAIKEAPCTIKSVKSLIHSNHASNCFITYTVNHGILWFDHVKSTWKISGTFPFYKFQMRASMSSSFVVTDCQVLTHFLRYINLSIYLYISLYFPIYLPIYISLSLSIYFYFRVLRTRCWGGPSSPTSAPSTWWTAHPWWRPSNKYTDAAIIFSIFFK